MSTRPCDRPLQPPASGLSSASALPPTFGQKVSQHSAHWRTLDVLLLPAWSSIHRVLHVLLSLSPSLVPDFQEGRRWDCNLIGVTQGEHHQRRTPVKYIMPVTEINCKAVTESNCVLSIVKWKKYFYSKLFHIYICIDWFPINKNIFQRKQNMTMTQHTKPRDILTYLKCDQVGSSDHWEKNESLISG